MFSYRSLVFNRLVTVSQVWHALGNSRFIFFRKRGVILAITGEENPWRVFRFPCFALFRMSI